MTRSKATKEQERDKDMDTTTKKDGGFTIKVGPYGLYAVLHEHRYVREDVLETSAEILDDRVYATEEGAQGAILLRIAEAYTGFVDGIEADMGVERAEARRFASALVETGRRADGSWFVAKGSDTHVFTIRNVVVAKGGASAN